MFYHFPWEKVQQRWATWHITVLHSSPRRSVMSTSRRNSWSLGPPGGLISGDPCLAAGAASVQFGSSSCYTIRDAHSLRFSNFNYEQPDARVFMVTAIMECALMFVMFVRGEMGRKLKSDCMPEQATVPRCLSPPPNIRAHHRLLPR